MKKTTIAQILFIIIIVAIVFYNLGVSYVLKHQEIEATRGGYEVTVFDNVFFYETDK
jgi:hypothetical protein